MLLRPAAILRPINKPSILVRIPGLTPAELQTWQKRLDPLAQECGCRSGAQAIGLYLLGVLVTVFVADIPENTRYPLSTYLFWSEIFLGGMILSALTGKLFGQFRAASHLSRACEELEQELSVRSEHAARLVSFSGEPLS
jgi:hypothetical protein